MARLSFRIPGVRYSGWKLVCDPVPRSEYERACSQCFPRGYPIVEEVTPGVVGSTLHDDNPIGEANDDLLFIFFIFF